MFIATLIAADWLDRSDIAEAMSLLRRTGCEPADWRWIDEGVAADLAFANDPEQARAMLEGPGNTYDVVVQPAEGREKKLLVADMDSTMITVECIDELADYAGIKAEIAAVTEAAMRGELDFAAALDARVALLKGLEASAIDRCLAERVTIMAGARALVRTMKARGAEAVISVSSVALVNSPVRNGDSAWTVPPAAPRGVRFPAVRSPRDQGCRQPGHQLRGVVKPLAGRSVMRAVSG